MKKRDSNKISIVIPFYNRKDFIKLMVDSIINQSYTNWELIMVDDGSEDGSKELVKEFEKIDSRIIYLRRSDFSNIKGACSCRNYGLNQATGKYIIFFDSDDWIHPDCLKNRLSFIENHPNLDFAVFPYFFYKRKDLINGEVVSGVPSINNKDALFNLLIRNLPFTVVSNIYKTQVLREKQILWDEHLMSLQDADFNISALLAGLSFDFCDKYGFDYFVRMNNNSSSVSRSILQPKHIESHLYYFLKQKERISKMKDTKLEDGLHLLSYSFYMLFMNNDNAKERLLQYADDKVLMIKDRVCSFLRKIGIPSKVITGLLFYRLSSKYRYATHRRKIKGLSMYYISKEIIENIEPVMM